MNEKNETNERSISSSQILRFVQKKRTEIYYELQSRNIDLYGYDQNRSVLISVTQLQPNFNTYTYIHTYIQPDAAVPVSVSIHTASQPVSQRLEPEPEPEHTHTYTITNVANGL